MNKILFYKGLPASGKDTDALERMEKSNGQLKRVNKDMLRGMIDNSKWSKERERNILNIRDMVIERYLREGYSVAVTDTNLAPKHYERIEGIASQFEVPVEVIEMNTSLVECLERNKKRDNAVPERVIWDMYYKYILPEKVEQNVYRPDLPSALIVDCDGTIAIHQERSPFDYHKCLSDKPNEYVLNIVRELAIRHKVIIVTGRENIIYPVGEYYEYPDVLTYTEKWLERNQVPYDEIYIREAGDHRKDYIVKKEIWENNIKDRFNIVGVFDDRKMVVDMWRELGLQVFDVAGNQW